MHEVFLYLDAGIRWAVYAIQDAVKGNLDSALNCLTFSRNDLLMVDAMYEERLREIRVWIVAESERAS